MTETRFLRRDGPRLFLDSRDLIGVIDKSEPISTRELAQELDRRHGRLVLTYTNVAELIPQTATQAPDVVRVREIMRRLQTVPHVFIRLGDLSRRELRFAVEAFDGGSPLRPVDPYVDHFWETFSSLPLPLARAIEPKEKIDLLCAWSLQEQVDFLLSRPEHLRFNEADGRQLAEGVEEDRARLRTRRGLRPSFSAGIKRQFIRYGWNAPARGIDQFCQFVYETPTACVSWRLAFDCYEEYRCNLTGNPTKNDIADYLHLHVLPYVTHGTLDRAWRARCQQARDRRARQGEQLLGGDRVYENLTSILKTL